MPSRSVKPDVLRPFVAGVQGGSVVLQTVTMHGVMISTPHPFHRCSRRPEAICQVMRCSLRENAYLVRENSHEDIMCFIR